ncbi:MAG: Mov34/MPN/PAD-1 family protein [Candidatus Krumholzibacteriota bacterium]|nr:Mov34/MPN/PAD-1 family protein [Candidatus Krumholzibacteriota bacterium]
MTQMERRFIDEMLAHATEDLPNECCGILAGQNGHVLKLYRMTNVEASPFRFSMDPGEIVKVDTEAGDNDWEFRQCYGGLLAATCHNPPERDDQ